MKPKISSRGKPEVLVDVRFVTAVDAGDSRAVEQNASTCQRDPMLRAAFVCALNSSARSGKPVSRVSCSRIREGTCVYWCCEDEEGNETCELLYCDA